MSPEMPRLTPEQLIALIFQQMANARDNIDNPQAVTTHALLSIAASLATFVSLVAEFKEEAVAAMTAWLKR
jgi:hypothetical protein